MMEMDIGLLALFVVLTIVNVILNTARTIVTVKGGLFWSSFISARIPISRWWPAT